MICIVPLAGPDFERADGSVKAEFQVDGQPLLRRALESRIWWQQGLLNGSGLIFILHDTARSRRFVSEKLAQWYPDCHFVYLSDFTAGAALSAVAALALVKDYNAPLVIDLCDILFSLQTETLCMLTDPQVTGGLAVTFTSDNPKYSYLVCDKAGKMVRSREKQVISNRASAGVYFFQSAAVFLRALAHSMDNAADLSFNNLLYICPALNGVIAQGFPVRCIDAFDVRDIHLP